ncbi:MAG: hypothetical protein GXY32_00545 [Ruminococcaceae bacterium]|nr:hypothetical protein [Oscillospiraceae bacterium]
MKKLLIFVVLAACLLTGCGTQPGGGADGSQTTSGSGGGGDVTPRGGPLVYAGNYAYLGTGTDAGFYFLKNVWNSNQLNITYVDYATQKHVYLCSNLSCAHNDDSCTSYVDANAGGASIMAVGDKLLVFYQGMMGYEGTPAVLPRIDMMDLNGANRKTLIQLGEQESLDYSAMHDGENAYFVRSTLISETTESVDYRRELVRVSLASGALETICGLEGWSYFTGAEGREIYLQSFEEAEGTIDQDKLQALEERMQTMYADPEAYTDEDFAAVESDYSAIYEEAQGEERIIMQLLNVDSGEKQQLNTWKRKEMEDSWYLMPDGIYYVENELGVLKKKDIATGEAVVVTDKLPKHAANDEAFNNYYIGGVYTKWMFLDYSQQEGELYTTGRLAVNRQSGEVKEMTMRPDVAYLSGLVANGGVRPLLDDAPAAPAIPHVVFTNGGWGTDPVQIITEVGDRFLVISGYDIRTEMYDGKVGELYPVEVETPIYALITQDDYVNSRPNYINVEFIE